MKLIRMAVILWLCCAPHAAWSDTTAVPSAEQLLGQIETAKQMGQTDVALAQRAAESMARVVGIGISPPFAIAAFGMVDWYNGNTDKWYSHPGFTVPMLIMFLLIFLKDSLGAPLGPLKQLADAAEVLANKINGLLGLFATMFYCADTMGEVTGQLLAYGSDCVVGTAFAAEDGGTATTVFATLGGIVAAVIAGLCFFVVWLTGQVFNIMILLNPFSFVDPFLKSLRGGFFICLAVLCTVFPPAGMIVALLYILISWLVAGYCLRVVGWGTVMSWDVVFKRGQGNPIDPRGILAFAGSDMQGIPKRTLGRLTQEDPNTLRFVYRPWFILPQKIHYVPVVGHQIVKGFLYPDVERVYDAGSVTVYSLPPRYKGLEDTLLTPLSATQVRDNVLMGGLKGFFRWVKALFITPTPDPMH